MPRAQMLFGGGFMLVGLCLDHLIGGRAGDAILWLGLFFGAVLLVMACLSNSENSYPVPTIGSFLAAAANSAAFALPEIPKPLARLKADAEFIDVTNEGAGAYFYAPIQIDGLVKVQKSGIFAKWEHTNSVRSWIAKGQTCRLKLARMDYKGACNQWVILAVLSDDNNLEIPAFYSSCAVSKPIIEAPDIVVTGQVIAEPDLENGIQQFGVSLRAFDAISVIQK